MSIGPRPIQLVVVMVKASGLTAENIKGPQQLVSASGRGPSSLLLKSNLFTFIAMWLSYLNLA